MDVIATFSVSSFQALVDFTGLFKTLQTLVITGVNLFPGGKEKHLVVPEIQAGLGEFPVVILFEIIHIGQHIRYSAVVKYKRVLKPACVPELVDSSLEDAPVEGKGIPDKGQGVYKVSLRIFFSLGGFGHFPDDLVKTGIAAFFKFPDQDRFPGAGPARDYDAFGHSVNVG